MSFVTESISSGFGLENRVIEQSFLNPNNPYKGYDIDIDSFQNTNQGLEDSNQDGRIPLGMFVFNDDNLAKNNFPDVLSPPFNNFVKFNLVNNGDCKFVEKVLCRFSSSPSSVLYPNDSPIVIKPVGDWNFLSLKTINDGEEILNHYPQEIEYELDSQGMEAYGGRYSYVPFAIENNKGDTVSPSYWNDIYNKLTGSGEINDITRFFGVNETQSSVNQALNSTNSNEMEEFRENRAFYKTGTLSNFDKPHVAMWLNTNEAYSNNRCLVFSNYQIWDNSKLNDYVRSEATNYTFNYLAKDNAHKKGTINDEFNVDESLILENQYRVLNQITKIYDKFNDNKINPYSSLKIRFKMKTTLVLPPGNDIESISENSDLFLTNPLNTSAAPKVEVGILNSQFNEVPNTDTDGLDYSPDYHGLSDDDTDYVTNHPDEQFKSPGSFNSTRFFNAVEFEDKKQTPLGGMTRFQNSIMNEWESFEFDFNLTEEHLNRGEIYGVPYGGAFNDVMNGYPGDIRGGVEILLNTNFANEKPSDSLGQIFFKFGDYQNTNWNNRPNGLYMIPPSIMSAFGQSNQSQIDFDSVFMIHDVTRDGADYMTVISQLGDSSNGQLTGKTTVDDGNGGTKTIFLEAYLMFIGSRQSTKDADKLTVNTNSSIENAGGNDRPHMIVAYWDGEQWTYDIGGNNGGYNPIYEFTPNEECFILARLYANEEGQGITGIDQYISNKTNFPTDGVGNLFLFLQSGNDFQGRVLIDDIECYESYEFNPDVDVRKKISVGNYARADLTKYYDPIIHGENGTDEYKDTQAPLEAQFYFYPKYPINEMFIESLPIYQDFKNGRFYI